MKRKRTERTGLVPVRHLSLIAGVVAALAAAPVSFPSPAAAAVATAAYAPRDQGIDDFYDARSGSLLWLRQGQANLAARQLLSFIDSARIDGLDPSSYGSDAITKELRKAAAGNKGAMRKADRLLSKAFVAYASDLRNAPAAGMEFVDAPLRPKAPSPRALLNLAASAPSLTQFMADMDWMNPDYAPLRRALLSGIYDGSRRDVLKINLERARVLPADQPRYVVVNAADQRLYMYEGDKAVDSMKVVVGQQRADRKTPMFAAYIRYAALNPYWNVPPDLVGDDVAIHVLAQGLGYLKSRGYEVLSDWTANATEIDPSTIDWQAVMDGDVQLRVRQNPGPHNVLGEVKYAMPNPFGVYLHDTANRALLDKDTRLYSGGCIRLEDAARLGTWLFGHELEAQSDDPEIEIPLKRPVPIYVTYMTAVPKGSTITFLDDVYGWDAKMMAKTGGSRRVAAR